MLIISRGVEQQETVRDFQVDTPEPGIDLILRSAANSSDDDEEDRFVKMAEAHGCILQAHSCSLTAQRLFAHGRI